MHTGMDIQGHEANIFLKFLQDFQFHLKLCSTLFFANDLNAHEEGAIVTHHLYHLVTGRKFPEYYTSHKVVLII